MKLLPLHPDRGDAEQVAAKRAVKAKMIHNEAQVLRSAADALDEIADSGEDDQTMTHAANFILETL